MTITTKHLNIGSNRGKPRLYIEGAALIAAGIPRGAPWILQPSDVGLAIHRIDHPAEYHGPIRVRTMSGKGSTPVADITGRNLGVLQHVERVTLHIKNGSIYIQESQE